MGILDSRNNVRAAGTAVLGDIRSTVAASMNTGNGQGSNGQQSERRPPSLFWLNVGVTLEGAGKDGEDLFVSLPMGIPLDDMKMQEVRGNSPDWINLVQAKNALLEMLQSAAAGLQPGERVQIPQLSVELARKSEPSQQGNASTNSLIGLLHKQLKT